MRGRCNQCRGDNVDIDYIIEPQGVTLYSTRMKCEKYVPFDHVHALDIGGQQCIRIKQRGKHFTIPIKRAHSRNQGATVVIPTAMLKREDGQSMPTKFEDNSADITSTNNSNSMINNSADFVSSTKRETEKNTTERPLLLEAVNVGTTIIDTAMKLTEEVIVLIFLLLTLLLNLLIRLLFKRENSINSQIKNDNRETATQTDEGIQHAKGIFSILLYLYVICLEETKELMIIDEDTNHPWEVNERNSEK